MATSTEPLVLRPINVQVCTDCLAGVEGNCVTVGCAFLLRARPGATNRKLLADLIDVTDERSK